jgi:hypothetical protein
MKSNTNHLVLAALAFALALLLAACSDSDNGTSPQSTSGGGGAGNLTCKSSDGSTCVSLPNVPGQPTSCSAMNADGTTFEATSSCSVPSGRNYCLSETAQTTNLGNTVNMTMCTHSSSLTCEMMGYTKGTQAQCAAAHSLMDMDALMQSSDPSEGLSVNPSSSSGESGGPSLTESNIYCKATDGSTCSKVGVSGFCSQLNNEEMTYEEASSCGVPSGRYYCVHGTSGASMCYYSSSNLCAAAGLPEGTQAECEAANAISNMDAR